MLEKIALVVRRVFNEQNGQVLPWMALGMVGFLGLAGLTIDIRHAYVAYDVLQASTNAAALAAAGSTYNKSGTTVTSQANLYGSDSAGKNARASLGTVQTTSQSECLDILLPQGTSCTANSAPNAVKVTQTASVPTYFLRVLGITSIPMSATAQAAMQGMAQQWNLAIIVDSTSSMSDPPDSNCNGYSTRFSCAMNGIQSLLAATNPCAPGFTSCASANHNVTVSLFTFPNVTTGSVASDYTCSGTPTKQPYTFPLPTATTYSSTDGATYQVTPFLSDYYQPSATNGLNPDSKIVKAITGCMKNPGGESTYYAGVIYAAQAALVAQHKLNTNSKNAIILLSDGQANVTDRTKMDSAVTLKTNGLYPGKIDECQQAIMAASAAAAAGTRVYAVAYGSESSGCVTGSSGTDTSLVATGTYNVPVALGTLTPCVTMEDIASSLTYFYADSSSSANACTDNAHSTNSLSDIFFSIASSITNPQLLPRDAHNAVIK
jgi:hypothetical protein